MKKTVTAPGHKLKKWNEARALSEQQGVEKFRRLLADPILHPSKFKK